MGFRKELYTREYFTSRDEHGNRLPYGAFGSDEWRNGSIYDSMRRIIDVVSMEGTDVLEIGYGRGESIRYMARNKGIVSYTGVDFSEAAHQLAMGTIAECPGRFDLSCGDALEFLLERQFDSAFDVAMMLDVIEHIPTTEVRQILPLIHRALRTGGVLIVVTPNYTVDEDYIAQGCQYVRPSPTDIIPQTSGMYCNKFTRERLQRELTEAGLQPAARDAATGPYAGLSSADRALIQEHLFTKVNATPVGEFAHHVGIATSKDPWPTATTMNAQTPSTPMDHAFEQARTLCRAGDLAKAEQLCHRIHQAEPEHAGACHLLAMIAHSRGQVEAAADHIRRAAKLDPANSDYQAHACEIFRRAGLVDEALAAGRAAVRLAPTPPGPQNNLGLALQDSGDLAAAEACFRRVIDVNPQYARAHHNLGIVLRLQNRIEEAAHALADALRLQPDYPQALNTLGVVRKLQHRLDEALECLRRALTLRPEYPSALLNLANALSESGRDDEALNRMRDALRLKPDYHEAFHDLGAMHERSRRRAAAAEAYEEALRLKPDSIEYLAAVENGRRHLCDWRGRPDNVERLLHAVDQKTAKGEASPLWPLASLRFPTSPAQRLAIARQHARGVAAQVAKSKVEIHKSQVEEVGPDGNGATGDVGQPARLRVGILSHEFGYNVVGHLTGGLYRRFDRDRFEILALDYSKDDGSDMRRRILGDCDRVIDLHGLTPLDCARRIRTEEVRILLDFNSYMPGGLPQIAALRPAPIQVAHMYPATTGADHIDYYLTDRIATIEGHERYFTEKLVYLPNAYLPTNGDQPIDHKTPTRSECGLPQSGFVYCSFNNSDKIEPQIFDVWMRILKRVEQSVLWQREDEAAAQDNLRREAEARGVDPKRLIFAPKISSTVQHLARHRCADLFLDTLTHGGHGTAADALWAGLPLITCPRETFTSRVAASLLAAAGLGDLIVDSLEAYEELAVALAENADRLEALRKQLKADRTTCATFDTDRYVRNLERAFLAMWHVYASGSSARTFSVIEERTDNG